MTVSFEELAQVYVVEVDAPISVSHSYVQQIGLNVDPESVEGLAIIASVGDNVENAYKTLPEFSVQDAVRNQTTSVVLITGEPVNGYLQYMATTNYTINNATIALNFNVQLENANNVQADLEALAEIEVLNFKAQWGWVDL